MPSTQIDQSAACSLLKPHVSCDGAMVEGTLRRLDPSAATVSFRRGEAPTLLVGGHSRLRIEGAGLDTPVDAQARTIVRRDEEDVREYVFELRDWTDLWSSLPAKLRTRLNRRRHLRLTPRSPSELRVEVPASETIAMEIRGRVVDISFGGAAVAFDSASEVTLAKADSLDLEFTFPNVKKPCTVRANVLRRSADEGTVVYGVSFVDQPEWAVGMDHLRDYTFELERDQIRRRI